jgi:hypothetical protein
MYEGLITNDINALFGAILKDTIQAKVPMAYRLQRPMSFALELLDNAVRHSTDQTIKFEWWVEDGNILIQLTNEAKIHDAYRLRDLTNVISNYSPEEVSAEYKRVMLLEGFNEHGGAGLGFLHMVKHGAKIEHVSLDLQDDEKATCVCKLSARIETRNLTMTEN